MFNLRNNNSTSDSSSSNSNSNSNSSSSNSSSSSSRSFKSSDVLAARWCPSGALGTTSTNHRNSLTQPYVQVPVDTYVGRMYNVECKEEGRKSSPKVVVIDYSSVRSLPFRSLYANVKLLLTGNGRPLLPVAVHFDDSNVSSATKKDLLKKNEPLESRTCERNITRTSIILSNRKRKRILQKYLEENAVNKSEGRSKNLKTTTKSKNIQNEEHETLGDRPILQFHES
ncbi:hypothetical protein HZH68_004786 [Vespula germanica]|uniref:Uncharacterized protein n=1 Tax=Vespula germanica TaxID=30212 RepID=A0A834NIL8_VESGE|nr:hypothetical protein HZH68_004786 [Vespula germanica]